MDVGALAIMIGVVVAVGAVFVAVMFRKPVVGMSSEERLHAQGQRMLTWIFLTLMFPIVVGVGAAVVIGIKAVL